MPWVCLTVSRKSRDSHCPLFETYKDQLGLWLHGNFFSSGMKMPNIVIKPVTSPVPRNVYIFKWLYFQFILYYSGLKIINKNPISQHLTLTGIWANSKKTCARWTFLNMFFPYSAIKELLVLLFIYFFLYWVPAKQIPTEREGNRKEGWSSTPPRIAGPHTLSHMSHTPVPGESLHSPGLIKATHRQSLTVGPINHFHMGTPVTPPDSWPSLFMLST